MHGRQHVACADELWLWANLPFLPILNRAGTDLEVDRRRVDGKKTSGDTGGDDDQSGNNCVSGFVPQKLPCVIPALLATAVSANSAHMLIQPPITAGFEVALQNVVHPARERARSSARAQAPLPMNAAAESAVSQQTHVQALSASALGSESELQGQEAEVGVGVAELLDYQKTLEEIYWNFNPEKVDSIPQLLATYEGAEVR